jgi:hypothetical protein
LLESVEILLFLSHSVLTVPFIESRNMRCGKHRRDEIFTQIVELEVLVLDVPSFVAPQKTVGGGTLERFYHTLCWKVLALQLLYGCLSRSFPTETLHTCNVSYKFVLLIQLRL